MLKRTPLFECHRKLGGRLVEFGGWEMPVQYTSIMEEHQAVRTAAGLFDISHMGEVLVNGPGAEAFLNRVLTNNVSKLAGGQGQYTILCNPAGGAIDDLYIYRTADAEYLLVINASRIDEDVTWLARQLQENTKAGSVILENISDQTGAIAIQGPKVVNFIDQCFFGGSTAGAVANRASELNKNQISQFRFGGEPLWVGRTGYTGEDGFEVVAPARIIAAVWTKVLEAGAGFGLKPAGLGARDTLRTEACYPLYGHELDERITPMEAGLGTFVAFDKGDFNGRAALVRQKEEGVSKRLAAFRVAAKAAPPRPEYAIWQPGEAGAPLGKVTSGTQSPTLGVGIGLGYVPTESAKPGTALEIEVRGRRVPAEVVKKPFYRKAV